MHSNVRIGVYTLVLDGGYGVKSKYSDIWEVRKS